MQGNHTTLVYTLQSEQIHKMAEDNTNDTGMSRDFPIRWDKKGLSKDDMDKIREHIGSYHSDRMKLGSGPSEECKESAFGHGDRFWKGFMQRSRGERQGCQYKGLSEEEIKKLEEQFKDKDVKPWRKPTAKDEEKGVVPSGGNDGGDFESMNKPTRAEMHQMWSTFHGKREGEIDPSSDNTGYWKRMGDRKPTKEEINVIRMFMWAHMRNSGHAEQNGTSWHGYKSCPMTEERGKDSEVFSWRGHHGNHNGHHFGRFRRGRCGGERETDQNEPSAAHMFFAPCN